MKTRANNIEKAAEILSKADAMLITAGAGMGVDSGLPDFRGNAGFWKAYPAAKKIGASFVEMANPVWFEKEPTLAWAFYGHRLLMYRETTPHKGFFQLLQIAKSKPQGYFVFTSNVDGQFQKAGFDDMKMYECHGSIHHLQCVKSCTTDIWSAENDNIVIDEATFRAKPPLPSCRNCGKLARPNVLMFGDWYWLDYRSNTQVLRFNEWLAQVNAGNYRIAIVEIGAGTAVPTVRRTSEQIASNERGGLIRINPRESSAPAGSVSIPLQGAEGIDRIVKAMNA